jgi:hypothetical protein
VRRPVEIRIEFIWMWVCVVSAVLCSAAMLTVRKIGKSESPLVLAMWFHSFSSCTGLLALALGLQKLVLPGAYPIPKLLRWPAQVRCGSPLSSFYVHSCEGASCFICVAQFHDADPKPTHA